MSEAYVPATWAERGLIHWVHWDRHRGRSMIASMICPSGTPHLIPIRAMILLILTWLAGGSYALAQSHAAPASNARALQILIAQADKELEAGPFSVMHKKLTPASGDKHDYMSVGPY